MSPVTAGVTALERRTDVQALAAAGVTVVLWASAFVGIRSAGHAYSPGALTLGRLLVAISALGTVGFLGGARPPGRAQLRTAGPALLLTGLLWFAAYNVALNAGERRVDAGTAAMLVAIGPVLIAILAGFLLREGFPRALFLGCAIAFVGVAVIAVATSDRAATTAGVLLCIAAALAYAGAVVAQKVVLRTLTGTQTIFLCCVIGALACLPFAAQLVRQTAAAPTGSIAWLVYLGLAPTALGFSTWAFALRRTDAGRLAATTYLAPPISILLGWLLLGESPVGLAYVGGALCLAGVAVSRRRTAARPTSAADRPRRAAA
jgi:drug/metabolite transporter (DMT)-like permease